jgi:hypothetical protein
MMGEELVDWKGPLVAVHRVTGECRLIEQPCHEYNDDPEMVDSYAVSDEFVGDYNCFDKFGNNEDPDRTPWDVRNNRSNTMTDTTKLAERIEALEGDERIWFIRAYEAVHGTECIDPKAWRRFEDLVNAGAFLDAAMTLVPEGWEYTIRKRHVELRHPVQRAFDAEATGATPALALCAAAIRAQEAHNG